MTHTLFAGLRAPTHSAFKGRFVGRPPRLLPNVVTHGKMTEAVKMFVNGSKVAGGVFIMRMRVYR